MSSTDQQSTGDQYRSYADDRNTPSQKVVYTTSNGGQFIFQLQTFRKKAWTEAKSLIFYHAYTPRIKLASVSGVRFLFDYAC